MNRTMVQGHTHFGYGRDGCYRCECGALMGSGLKEAGSAGVVAMKDQWAAHKAEAVANGAEVIPA